MGTKEQPVLSRPRESAKKISAITFSNIQRHKKGCEREEMVEQEEVEEANAMPKLHPLFFMTHDYTLILFPGYHLMMR
jgi:hypothetical protein